MFAIEELWKIEKLKPLQKAHDADPMDRRLVVVTDSTQPGGVNIAETEALHTWLEKQGYRRIPDQWESADLDNLQVVHVSQLSLEVMRRDPFSLSPWTGEQQAAKVERISRNGEIVHVNSKAYSRRTGKSLVDLTSIEIVMK